MVASWRSRPSVFYLELCVILCPLRLAPRERRESRNRVRYTFDQYGTSQHNNELHSPLMFFIPLQCPPLLFSVLHSPPISSVFLQCYPFSSSILHSIPMFSIFLWCPSSPSPVGKLRKCPLPFFSAVTCKRRTVCKAWEVLLSRQTPPQRVWHRVYKWR